MSPGCSLVEECDELRWVASEWGDSVLLMLDDSSDESGGSFDVKVDDKRGLLGSGGDGYGILCGEGLGDGVETEGGFS